MSFFGGARLCRALTKINYGSTESRPTIALSPDFNQGVWDSGNKKPHRLLGSEVSEILVCESEPDRRATQQQRVPKQSNVRVPNHGAERIDRLHEGQRHFSLSA